MNDRVNENIVFTDENSLINYFKNCKMGIIVLIMILEWNSCVIEQMFTLLFEEKRKNPSFTDLNISRNKLYQISSTSNEIAVF